MKTIHVVLEDEAQVEKALEAFGKSGIRSRNVRILALHDTPAVQSVRRSGVSANATLGLAAAPHEQKGRRERIHDLLVDHGLKGAELDGLIAGIEHGETVVAMDVPAEEAERARRILTLED